LNIVVCIKQTPDSAAKIAVEGGQVTWGDAPLVVNPWDEFAVEEALRTKEKHTGKVTAVCMGTETAREALKTALAMGCDEAVLVSDAALKGCDSLGTARVLAGAVRKAGDVDAVFFGRQAIDSDTGLTAGQVARLLGWPAITYVAAIEEWKPAEKVVRAQRMLDEGRQVVESSLPVVISVVKEINEPRYPSFMGIRKASKATIPTWSLADIGVAADQVGEKGARVGWAEMYAPPVRQVVCEMIKGETPEEIAAALVDRLIAEKVI
jgi:electron transfer flavoprotein beta subunit